MMGTRRRWYGALIVVLLLLVVLWLLPLSGQVLIVPEGATHGPWPRFRLEPAAPEPGLRASVQVTDVEPWTFVHLLVDGRPADAEGQATRSGDAWTWRWTFDVPEAPGYTLVFYRDCHTGCVERGRMAVGTPRPRPTPAAGEGVSVAPTALGLVLPDPERDWHGRRGWAVEIAYARLAEAPFWGVDDLATRVAAHRAQGLRVLVRVDYDQDQSLPAVDDYVALTEYLAFMRRLARDARLHDVYGYIIGNDYNTLEANRQAPHRPVTPAWYARVFNGYGAEVAYRDNAVAVLREERPEVRVIVGPVRPWVDDQDGELRYRVDVPWLNYMHTLVARLDAGAQAKAAAGIPLAAPDGFDVQAPGLPDAPEMAGQVRADEPRVSLRRDAWQGARVGFRVYRDWQDIINLYPTTQGLPIYIISTNTYDRAAEVPPAQNYPPGWLTTALEVVNDEPQIVALCWFLDTFPHSDQWSWFSLSERRGRLVDAADEFELLLQE
jgi:hypothetical protein